MKALLKSITFPLIFILVVGVGVGFYILQAPPVEQKEVPKLQIHRRAAVRGRPTVNSKPLVYTKDVYLFSMDRQYISNLNSGRLARELLFSAALAHRARLKGARLDEALKTATDWQKMFADLTENIRFRPSAAPIEVLLSGEEWRLRDATGAAYTVVRFGNRIDVYLPELKEAFDANKITLSTALEVSTEATNRRWLIKDKKHKQTYCIQSSEGKLNVFQQSKFEILTFLFEVDSASQTALAEDKLSPELIQGFATQKIPLSRQVQVSANEDGVSWQITDAPLKYNIRTEGDRLKVSLDLESRWLRIKVDDSRKGWVQSERGTIFEPPPPRLSSRQQAKERLLTLIDRFKEKEGMSDETNQTQNAAVR